jgi:hypothetical protein
MAIFTPGQITFSGEEVRELSQVIFEKEFRNPEISLFHTVDEGIKADKQIAFMTQLSGLLGAGSGGCSPTSASNAITSSTKTWSPKAVSDRLEACYTDLKPSFINYSLKNGVEEADLTSVDFFNYVADVLLKYKVYEAALRLAWFGDTAADDVDASPAGVLTSGTNPDYFNKLDGFWKQIYAIVAADSDRKTTDLTSRNGQASKALQVFTSTDTTNKVVMNALQNTLYGADLRLRERGDLVYVVTQSVADQYSRELKNSNVAFTTERYENGISILKSDGIEVIAFSLWDRIIKAYYDNGTTYLLPHRIVLTTKENLRIGFDSIGSLAEFDVHYDRTTKKNYIDFALNMDAKVMEDELIQVSY